MKIAGIVLIILQVVSLIPALVSGEAVFVGGIPNLLGRFAFGIIGVILLVIAHKRGGRG